MITLTADQRGTLRAVLTLTAATLIVLVPAVQVLVAAAGALALPAIPFLLYLNRRDRRTK